ncbi:unnamed protein product [Nyctereutes procyonoides]|uniref:(raccoon dog) hypothetical protein n=1 Tax=Nyctereutes procyonoides TaxID=34880 RepID=A0A811Z3B8_NYCPR|nr:unnamed protein product [Nyctereutes procyonoides]
MSVSGLESGGGHREGSQNRSCPICFANDLLRTEVGSQGWRPFDPPGAPSPQASSLVAQKGWEMGAAETRLRLAQSFGAPCSPRSLHTTVGSLSRHHAPSCRAPGAGVPARPEWRLRAPPVPAARLGLGAGRGGGWLLRRPPKEVSLDREKEAARGGARASGPGDCGGGSGGGGGGAAGKFPGRPRGAPSSGCSLRAPRSLSGAGTGAAEWSRPSPQRGGGGGGRGPRGSCGAPPCPLSSPPPPLIWRAREAQLGASAPARERPAPAAQLTRGPRNAEPSPVGSRRARAPAPVPARCGPAPLPARARPWGRARRLARGELRLTNGTRVGLT